MVLASFDYKIIYFDVSMKGRISDGGVFINTSLYAKLENGTLNIPPPRPLPNENIPVPFVIVADNAFAIRTYLMKPFPFGTINASQRIFNYRLSRARRLVESVFGILFARFRILEKPINLNERKAKKCVASICALHNFLINSKFELYVVEDFEPLIEAEVESRQPNNIAVRNDMAPLEVRQRFREYFISAHGRLPWQDSRI